VRDDAAAATGTLLILLHCCVSSIAGSAIAFLVARELLQLLDLEVSLVDSTCCKHRTYSISRYSKHVSLVSVVACSGSVRSHRSQKYLLVRNTALCSSCARRLSQCEECSKTL
jgi:hypothetical protein